MSSSELRVVASYREQLERLPDRGVEAPLLPRRRWPVLRVAIVAAVLLVVTLVALPNGKRADAAAQAYAAVSIKDDQLLHFRTTMITRDASGRITGDERVEAWVAGPQRTHIINVRMIGGRPHRVETVATPTTVRVRLPSGRVISHPARPVGVPVDDPAASFRRLYELDKVGPPTAQTLHGRPVLVFSLRFGDSVVDYIVDESSFRPVLIRARIIAAATGKAVQTTTTRVAVYERQALTAMTRLLLNFARR